MGLQRPQLDSDWSDRPACSRRWFYDLEELLENRLTHHFSLTSERWNIITVGKIIAPSIIFSKASCVWAVCLRFYVSLRTILAFKKKSPRTKHPRLNGNENWNNIKNTAGFILLLRAHPDVEHTIYAGLNSVVSIKISNLNFICHIYM